MRIALAQVNPTVGALSRNAAQIKKAYREARAGGAGLVLFPELVLTGYPPQDLLSDRYFIARAAAVVENDLAPLTAREGGTLLAGAPYRDGNRLYNAALLLAEGSLQAVIPKTILHHYITFAEQHYFSPATGRHPVSIAGTKTGITIGEDLGDNPNPGSGIDPLQELAGLGARLLINLSARPYRFGNRIRRERAFAVQARKHRFALLYLNQVGGNDELVFDGASLIFNHRGELLRRGASFSEDLVFIDTETLFAPAAEPQPEREENIESVHAALCLGIHDYLAKSGFSRAALGLSGGLDSAVVAALAVAALGRENVLGVLMPSPYSPDHGIADALACADNLGLARRIIPIHEPLQAVSGLFGSNGLQAPDPAIENLQARLRGTVLMFISNREGYLVLTTGNRSELAVGYCTLYGDMAGGLAVLKDLPKLTVYELARFINRKHGRAIIPENTLTKPPSAELRPDQKDEDSLPPYTVLDPVLSLYLDQKLAAAEITGRGYPEETVRKITGLVDRSEYKRRQAAPGLYVVSPVSGPGRRMPLARGDETAR